MRTNSSRNGPSCDRLGFRIDLLQLCGAQQAVLVELRLDEPERQPRRPDLLHPDLAHQKRQRADVVFVRVRQDDGADRRVAEVAEVRQDHVDAEVLVARERHAGVDDDPLAAGLVHGHVLADLAEAAERDHAERFVHLASQCREVQLDQAATSRPSRSRQPRTACELVLARVRERQAVPADRMAQQAQRGLDRDRVRDHAEQLVHRRQGFVDLTCPRQVALLHRPHLLVAGLGGEHVG